MNKIKLAKQLVKIAKELVSAEEIHYIDFSDDIKILEGECSKNKLTFRKDVKELYAKFTISKNGVDGVIESELKNRDIVYNAKSPNNENRSFNDIRKAIEWMCMEVLQYNKSNFLKDKIDDVETAIKKAGGRKLDEDMFYVDFDDSHDMPSINCTMFIGNGGYESLQCEINIIALTNGKWKVCSDTEIDGANYSDISCNDFNSALRNAVQIVEDWASCF